MCSKIMIFYQIFNFFHDKNIKRAHPSGSRRCARRSGWQLKKILKANFGFLDEMLGF